MGKLDELYHHGVVGMRWGVRRYQNEDGTLTDAGKKRYGTSSSDTTLSEKSKSAKELASRLTTQSIKGGKDRPNVSPVEKTVAETEKIIDAVDRLRNGNKKIDPVVKLMSDDELRARINRMDMERRYSELTAKEIANGMSIAKDVLAIVGSAVAIYATLKTATKG